MAAEGRDGSKMEAEEELLKHESDVAEEQMASSKGRRWGIVLGTCAAVVAGAAAVAMSKDGSIQGSLSHAVQLAKKEKAKATTEEEEKSKCAAGQENCHESQCCEGPGMQCYEQNDDFAQCRPSCTPGPDPTHWDGNEWSCAELGPRAEGDDICGAAWQECTQAKCCKDIGFQCYQKNSTYATCKSECTTGGPDLSDGDSKPWTCKEVGSRKPTQQPWIEDQCSAGLDNCVDTKCCKVPGQQCFLQNDYYGNCLTACVGVGDGDPWSCKPLGSVTPLPVVKGATLSPWTLQTCSLPYTGCLESKCCLGANMQCYSKADGWAACMEGCKPGKNPDDNDEEWECKELGPRTYGLAIKGFPSLYCFSLMQPTSYEYGLLKAHLEKGAGIFECDEYAVLTQDEESTLDGPKGPVTSIKFQGAPVVTSQDNTAGNTKLFVNAWNAVVGAKTWQNHSWIVKADPDAVIIPERLRWHLAPHTGDHVFIVNCNKYPGPNYPMMYGALEVFSHSAIQAWAENGKDCYAPNTYGEDFYMTRCMDKLGVARILDEKILGDNLCMGANCADGWIAAFHPYKDIDSWKTCYDTAVGTPQ